jgi:hypothetical protein
MSLAYYPNRIRTFTTHRNLLDDVDANDINGIQAELLAVMQSLGTSPAIYNNIETDNSPTTVVPNDPGGVSDDDTIIFSTVLRYYDPKVKPVDHGNVGQRLDDIERGLQHHSFRLRASGLDIASKSVALDQRPRGIRFPKPTDAEDPFAMHNGVGVTLRKAGFWIFSGSVAYTLQGTTANSNNGIYEAVLDWDGNFIEGMDRSQETGTNAHPILNPMLMGFFNRGTRISLRTSHNSGRNQKVRTARMAGTLIRETVG